MFNFHLFIHSFNNHSPLPRSGENCTKGSSSLPAELPKGSLVPCERTEVEQPRELLGLMSEQKETKLNAQAMTDFQLTKVKRRAPNRWSNRNRQAANDFCDSAATVQNVWVFGVTKRRRWALNVMDGVGEECPRWWMVFIHCYNF